VAFARCRPAPVATALARATALVQRESLPPSA
jgi:hypothetical protein